MPLANSAILLRHQHDRNLDCLAIEWYLNEVFPGLLMDVENVQSQYAVHLSSPYLETALQALVDQYNKQAEHYADELTASLLRTRAENLKKQRSSYNKHEFLEPNRALSKRPATTTAAKAAAVNNNIDGAKKDEFAMDKFDLHAEKVRSQLLCQDVEVSAGEVRSLIVAAVVTVLYAVVVCSCILLLSLYL